MVCFSDSSSLPFCIRKQYFDWRWCRLRDEMSDNSVEQCWHVKLILFIYRYLIFKLFSFTFMHIKMWNFVKKREIFCIFHEIAEMQKISRFFTFLHKNTISLQVIYRFIICFTFLLKNGKAYKGWFHVSASWNPIVCVWK